MSSLLYFLYCLNFFFLRRFRTVKTMEGMKINIIGKAEKTTDQIIENHKKGSNKCMTVVKNLMMKLN